MSARQIVFLICAALLLVFVIWLIKEFPRLTRQPKHARPSRPASHAKAGESADRDDEPGEDPFTDPADEDDPEGDKYIAMLNEDEDPDDLPARDGGEHEAPPAPGWSHEPHPIPLLERLRDALQALPGAPEPPAVPEETVPAEAPEAPYEPASENTLKLLPVTAFPRGKTNDEYLDEVFAEAEKATGLLVARHLGSDEDAAEPARPQEAAEESAA